MFKDKKILALFTGSIVFINTSLIPPTEGISTYAPPMAERMDTTTVNSSEAGLTRQADKYIFNSDRDVVLRVPYVHQYEDLPEDQKPIIMKSACGPTVLTMLFKFNGIEADLMAVINKLPASVYVKGDQFYNLPKGAELYNFNTQFVGSDATSIYETLKDGKPIIMNIQNYNGIIGHAVVVAGIMGYDGESAEYLIIHDPYSGPYRKFEYNSPRTLTQPEGYTNYIGTVRPFILVK